MVRQLPRRLDDYAFNMNIKKNFIHKSVYLHGFVWKSVVRAWLAHLVNTPLYKHYNFQVDLSVLDVDSSWPAENDIASDNEQQIERVSVENTGSRLHPSRATRINRILHVSNAWCLL
jgi:hypothetical protein